MKKHFLCPSIGVFCKGCVIEAKKDKNNSNNKKLNVMKFKVNECPQVANQ